MALRLPEFIRIGRREGAWCQLVGSDGSGDLFAAQGKSDIPKKMRRTFISATYGCNFKNESYLIPVSAELRSATTSKRA